MLSTALIAEDQQNSNDWLQQNLKARNFESVQYAYYCDDALLALKRALEAGRPYDLLVTDLSFIEDPTREQKLKNGSELIAAARLLQPDLKVLVFSAETQVIFIKGLFDRLEINGYILKGRRDTEHLNDALNSIAKHTRYVPPEFQQMVRSKNAHDFSDYDLMIITRLAEGMKQKDIPEFLQQQGVKASSLSSIEKRLSMMKESYGFTNNEQLIAYCKDYNII